ncbi:MAG: 30S ribosomal protein S18 [Anaerolineae bacterium]|nr:MAG: 30S ribosomal protein S18 [Anaerolineae bacterium]
MAEEHEEVGAENTGTEETAGAVRDQGRARRRPPRRASRRRRRPRQCAFCVSKVSDVDYKQVDLLRPYVMERGKIRPRRQTGLCAKHQRRLAQAIKRARHLALVPFITSGRR